MCKNCDDAKKYGQKITEAMLTEAAKNGISLWALLMIIHAFVEGSMAIVAVEPEVLNATVRKPQPGDVAIIDIGANADTHKH